MQDKIARIGKTCYTGIDLKRKQRDINGKHLDFCWYFNINRLGYCKYIYGDAYQREN